MVFVAANGAEIHVSGPTGTSVLEMAHIGGVDIEGACEGNMACSTCHVVVDASFFDKLPVASEDEEEMLDLASGLKPTSRLGCQLLVSDALEGLRVYVPRESRNMMGL